MDSDAVHGLSYIDDLSSPNKLRRRTGRVTLVFNWEVNALVTTFALSATVRCEWLHFKQLGAFAKLASGQTVRYHS